MRRVSQTLPLPQATCSLVERWLRDPRYAEDRPALQRLVEAAQAGDDDAIAELRDAFDGPLPIGTGGRRGACGPGTNRMNLAVLRETAQGLADAMAAEGVPNRVAVVYDTRRDSRRFAHAVAQQLADCGVDVLVVDAPRPTPLLSYITRARGCGAGIVISASHNPAGDNGIKVYGPDGAQVLGQRDRALMAAIERAMSAELREGGGGAIEVLAGDDELAVVDRPYLEFVRAQGVCGPEIADAGLHVVFTPLHGVGHTSVLPVLRGCGLHVEMVAAQGPDGGQFGTVRSANPEQPAALELARAQAECDGADLVIATDPDADRLGAMARGDDGSFAFIDGNRLAVLMLDHVLRHIAPAPHGWVLTTVVSSPLIGALARGAGVEVVDDLLVGFKHHAGMMAEAPERTVVFATEEAHGYLRGDDVHDKDGAVAALLLAEAAAVAKAAGEGMLDQLRRVWTEHGYHRERTENIFAYGAEGREAIAGLMDAWRRDPPRSFGGLSVVEVVDRQQPRHTGSPTRDLPGNVLVFELQTPGTAACRLVLRPSGTEPKVKVYALGRSTRRVGLSELAAVEAEIDALVQAVLSDARAQAERAMKVGA
jgi:phosphomannomutase